MIMMTVATAAAAWNSKPELNPRLVFVDERNGSIVDSTLYAIGRMVDKCCEHHDEEFVFIRTNTQAEYHMSLDMHVAQIDDTSELASATSELRDRFVPRG